MSRFKSNSNWAYSITENPFTDEKDYYFGIYDAQTLKKHGYNIVKTKTLIIAKQGDDIPQFFLSTPYYLGDNNKVKFRFDKTKPFSADTWNFAESRNALFFRNRDNILQSFVGFLLRSNQVAFKIKPYKRNIDLITFELKGMKEVIGPHLKELGWEDLR